jgi:ADP-heptose:LPS heptosyltransferase
MRIAVLRALQLGDFLVAVPALRALRRGYPAAHIALVALPWTRALVERFSRYIDELVEYPGAPADYDLVVQMHGDGSRTNAIALALNGKRTAGFYRSGTACPDPETFIEWDERENEVLRYLRLAEKLGGRGALPELEFPLLQADIVEWSALRLGNYVCVHAGSQLPSRRWPRERFAAIADWLAACGYEVVLTGGAGEAALVQDVERAMRARPLNLAGKTSLGGLGALVARAHLVVCNDTSLSHIAAAMRTPSVVIACGSDPRRWAPLDRQLHRVLYHDVECRPCMNAECPIGHPCALQVSSGTVIQELSRMLACAA